MSRIIKALREELRMNSDETIKKSTERFFKEDVKSYGIKSAVVKKISRDYFKQVKDNSKVELFGLCEELWHSGYIEESFVACDWSYNIHKKYERDDFRIFEKWVNEYLGNWASCDTLCNHSVGAFIEMYPEYINELKKWAKSKNRWVRRASAVSLIVPAKKGEFLKDVFEISDILLSDEDDLVRKGYGWMLKVASQAHLKEVFDYVMSKKTVMPRTSLRYAIEKMPENMKAEAMKK